MLVSKMNWMQVEDYLKTDNRCLIPIGAVEQHAHLSLASDTLIADRLATEAGELAGVVVFPTIPYGVNPLFSAYPGSVSLKLTTMVSVMRDLLVSATRMGFHRILIVNGHGGNMSLEDLSQELMDEFPASSIRLHSWWTSLKTAAKWRSVDASGSHANWLENFSFTRLEGVHMPTENKPAIDHPLMRSSSPEGVRAVLGDGSYGGPYQIDDEKMDEIWQVAVRELAGLLDGPWGHRAK